MALTGTDLFLVARGTANYKVTADEVSAFVASVLAATQAEAAAGTITTKFLTPATGVPKDAAGMTGAALIPGGNDGARPAPVTGMLRYNNQAGTPVLMEYYNGANWQALAPLITPGTLQAWVNFDGSTTPPLINASGGVSGVTRTATGTYLISFTTPQIDTSFITLANAGGASSVVVGGTLNNIVTVNDVSVRTYDTNATVGVNPSRVSLAVFR